MEHREEQDAPQPEDHPDEVGAEGGSGSSNDAPAPFAPAEEDDTPLGDTDQHSKDPG